MKHRILAASAAIALVTLAACGTSSPDDSGSGPWTYTDDRGTTITLDETPKRVVAQSSLAAGLKDLGVEVVGVFGPLKRADGSLDPQAAGLDPDTITDVTAGGEYGSIDLEKLATLKPDLVVTNMYLPPELWYINDATAKKVAKLAPILAVDFKGDSIIESIEDVQKVGAKLGADLDSATVLKGRTDFDAASKRLTDVGAKLADREVLVVSGTKDLFYAADPAQFPDLDYYESLGLPVIKAKAKPGSYWEDMSWEKSDRYDADVVMWDSREGGSTLQQFKDQPVFSTITAAKNDSWVPWEAVAPASFAAYADVIDRLADDIEEQL